MFLPRQLIEKAEARDKERQKEDARKVGGATSFILVSLHLRGQAK